MTPEEAHGRTSGTNLRSPRATGRTTKADVRASGTASGNPIPSGRDAREAVPSGEPGNPRARASGTESTPNNRPESDRSATKARVRAPQAPALQTPPARSHQFEAAVVNDVERQQLRDGLGRRLQLARTAAGLSQRQLARAAGTAHTTISRIETGNRRARRTLLASLAAALDPTGNTGLLERLILAAGESLAEDTIASKRRRRRRVSAAEATRRRAYARARTLDAQAVSIQDAFTRQLKRRGFRPGAVQSELGDVRRRIAALHAEAATIRAAHLPPPRKAVGTVQNENARTQGLGPIPPRSACAHSARPQ